jgi:hypothetical protein
VLLFLLLLLPLFILLTKCEIECRREHAVGHFTVEDGVPVRCCERMKNDIGATR